MASPSRIPRTPRNGLSSGGCGRNAQRLVGAGVERADDQRAAVERGGDVLVDRALLVLRRRLVAVQEQELGPQQPDAVGAELDRGLGVGDRADVGGHLDRLAVAQCAPARARARAPARAAPRPRRARARARPASRPAGRPRPCRRRRPARAAVPSATAPDGVPEADDGGDPERAGEDRGVRGGAAAGDRDAPDELAVERRGVARRQVAARPARPAPRWRPRRAVAGQVAQDAAADVLDVDGALAQVGSSSAR